MGLASVGSDLQHGNCEVEATSAGYAQLFAWVGELNELAFGLEGTGSYKVGTGSSEASRMRRGRSRASRSRKRTFWPFDDLGCRGAPGCT